jgi:phage terminase small subunit
LKALVKMPDINESTPARHLGILKNPRWEAFAHAVARGSTVDAAYQEAGYAGNRGNACRLNSTERVKIRVAELKLLVQNLQKRSSHSVVLNEAWVLEQLVGIVLDARALDRPDFAGANKALNLIGLQLGMYVERKEVGKPGDFDGLSIADKRERIMDVARQLGLGGVAPGERMIGVSRAKLLQLINDGKGE